MDPQAPDAQVKATLPDGSVRSYRKGTSFAEIAAQIGPGLAKDALAVKVGDKLLDINERLTIDAPLEFITERSAQGVDVIRHSTAHVLAMAVQKLWPGTQVTIGPVIEHGFFYDFAFPDGVKITDADLPKIEETMLEIVRANYTVTREVVVRQEILDRFEKMGERFKTEIIRDLPNETPVSIYKMGNWFDLCVGPHVPRTSALGAFKLTHIAGSYWRGDEKNARLTRIYGTAWATKKDLEEHLARIEEAKKRDHRALGKQLDLFSFHVESPANPFFHPKGMLLYNLLMAYIRRNNQRHGFEEVGAPLILNVDLWKKSGHYEFYRENMYFTQVDETEAAVKPMNCPGHCLIYSNQKHSYRELPLRFSEFGRVHRHERSGVTHGLFRVRSFVQDDGHVFCMPEQIGAEVFNFMEQIREIYSGLSFNEYRVKLATKPAKAIGSDEIWERAESELHQALKSAKVEYQIAPGEGAFYGPKVEIHLIDSLGRSWQCGTVQLDFSMPSRFGLEFTGKDDKPHTPVMLHRAVLGSMERFLGILIEHFAGHFPIWIAPVQVRVISITEAQIDYCKGVLRELLEAGIRADLDLRGEKLGYKIREAQMAKIPYMIVIGDKEMHSTSISPRSRDGVQHEAMSTGEFIGRVIHECGSQWGL